MSLELVQIAVLLPLLAAVLVGALPRSEPALARALGLVAALVELALVMKLVLDFDPSGPLVQQRASWSWLPAHGVEWSLGVEGGSLWWLVLIAVVVPLALMSGGPSRPGEPPLIVGMLGLEAAWIAVVLAQDLLSMAAAWEFATVATIILLGERGDGKRGIAGRVGAARRFAGPALVSAAAFAGLVVLIGVASSHARDGVLDWDLASLASVTLPASWQRLGLGLALLTLVCGLPLLPLQVPLAQVCSSGPTPVVAAVLGVGMPMSLFLLRRVLLPCLPLALAEWADPLAALVVVGAIYGALACWAEREPGRLLAHVALVHLSLGVVAVLAGSVSASQGLGPYLLAHGLGLTMLTAVLHSLRRNGVRDLAELAGWAEVAPRSLVAGLAGALICLGLPGSAGFVGSLAVVSGALAEGQPALQHPGVWVLLAAAAVGLGSLGVVRGLWLAGRGVPRRGADQARDLGMRESIVACSAVVLALGLGLLPAPLLARTQVALEAGAEALALRRCLAIEAREQPRPRLDEELDAVCLDPRARIRQFYGLETEDAAASEPSPAQEASP